MNGSIQVRLVVGLLLSIGLWGCATGSGAQKDQAVQGEPPPPEEANEPAVRVGPEVEAESLAPSDDEAGTEDASPSSRSGEGVTVTRSRVQTLIEKGPAYILQAVSVEPARTDGEFVGYEIVGMTEAARRVANPQLSVGDVIESINGTTIERPDDYVSTWKDLNRVDRVVIGFRRDGESKRAVWTIVDR
jgi:type II secretory pathway component PulC